MGAILDFLIGLGGIILAGINFLFGLIKDLLYIVTLLGSLIIRVSDMIGWLPSACITLVGTTFGIVLIYKLLGREG